MLFPKRGNAAFEGLASIPKSDQYLGVEFNKRFVALSLETNIEQCLNEIPAFIKEATGTRDIAAMDHRRVVPGFHSCSRIPSFL